VAGGIEAHAFMNEEIGPVCSPALPKNVKIDLRSHPRLHTETRPMRGADWWARSGAVAIDASREQRFRNISISCSKPGCRTGCGRGAAPAGQG